MSNSIHLSKLVVLGDDKKTASIEFTSGLNLIKGISDTGKTYVFDCIDFMFGASDAPKEIPESKGYEIVRLEILSGEDFYTLERNLEGGDFRVYEKKIENIQDGQDEYRPLRKQHKAENKQNISRFLLDKFGIDGVKNLRKNSSGDTKTLSFRSVNHFFLVDEDFISEEISPIYTGDYVNRTTHESAFEFFLTGKDDSYLKEQLGDQESSESLENKQELLEDLIDEIKQELEAEPSLEELREELNNNEEKLEGLTEEISTINEQINELENVREEQNEQLNEIESKIIEKEELINRFKILKDQYNSDLDRLKFIEEGSNFFDQLRYINCPLCGNSLEEHELNESCEEEKDTYTDEQIYEACVQETGHIKSKLSDLTETINDLKEDKKILSEKKQEGEEKLKQIQEELSEKLQPAFKERKNQLESIRNTREKLNKIEELHDRKKLFQEKIRELERRKEGIKDQQSDIDTDINLQSLNDFCQTNKDILNNWLNSSIDTINYDQDDQDIVIDGRKRQSYGQGMRGLLHASFKYALMEHCIQNGTPHPKFLVIDTPLTTFKGKGDYESEEVDEEVEESIKLNCLRNLAEISNEKQIVIIENDPPLGDLDSKINLIEFTRTTDQGRYGFYPKA